MAGHGVITQADAELLERLFKWIWVEFPRGWQVGCETTTCGKFRVYAQPCSHVPGVGITFRADEICRQARTAGELSETAVVAGIMLRFRDYYGKNWKSCGS